MEDERIEIVRDLPEPYLVQDIQVFLRFNNAPVSFQGFSQITALLIPMLRITTCLAVNKSIFADSIDWVDSDKVIVEAINKEFGTRFINPGAILAFASVEANF